MRKIFKNLPFEQQFAIGFVSVLLTLSTVLGLLII